MSINDVKAEILNLSVEILMGKATEEKIEGVVKLALDNGQSKFLADEFRSIGQILKV